MQLPGKSIEYVIDASNRRVGKKVNGQLVQGLVYQGKLKPVAELDANEQLVARFVYGSKANVPDYILKNGNTYRVIADHLGSPRLVVDIQTGAVVQSMDFDSFGQMIQDSNPGFQPFGFAGGLYDSDTKLVRFGARDYDSETGRWTSKDPINFRGKSANLYDYVFGDPVNYRDATGRYAQAVAGVAAVAAIVAGIAYIYIYNHILNQNKGTEDAGEGTSEGTSDEGASTGGTETANDVIDDIRNGSTLTDTTGKTRNYEREGGRAQRDKDFDSLPGELLPTNPDVKVLPDGRHANKHDSRTKPYEGQPTLDVPNPNATNPASRLKFRYPTSCP